MINNILLALITGNAFLLVVIYYKSMAFKRCIEKFEKKIDEQLTNITDKKDV